jgi:hypothetical protein
VQQLKEQIIQEIQESGEKEATEDELAILVNSKLL